MAYGSSELDVAASTTDLWLNEGTNGIDLLSGHNPLVAILFDNSMEPGGEWQFQEREVGEGNQFKYTVYGNTNTTVDGVTRANQVNAISPTVPGAGGAASVGTNVFWPWSHYQGIVFDNYEDRAKNSGKSQMIDLGNMYLDQIQASFFQLLGTDLLDNAAGSISKIQSVNACLANTGTVGGVDQSDTANNSWWNAQQDTTTEIWNTQTFDTVRDACTFDTGRTTGIRKGDPDIAFLYGGQYSLLRQDLKASQRQAPTDTLRGGAKYLDYDGCRCFRTTQIVSGTSLILNSTTWAFVYKTRMPEPVTPGWVPRSGTPGMWERGFNWFIGFGGKSMKHNGLLTNKTLS